MNLTRFVKFLLRGSKGTLLVLIVSGLLSGICGAGLLAVINVLLHQTSEVPRALALMFVSLAFVKIATNGLAQLLLVYFAQDTILDLGLKLCTQVTKTPFRMLEKKGPSYILVTLMDDVSALAWALQCVPSLTINGAVLVGCAAYLAWLSWTVFLGVVGLIAVGVLTYKVLHDRAFEVIYAARESRTALFRHFRSLTEGIKELMMHRGRREAFLADDVVHTALALRHLNLIATKRYMIVDGWTQLLFYGLIGAVLLVFPQLLTFPAESVTGYVFAMLYMMNPMWAMIGTLPTLIRGQVALQKIEELGLSLESLGGAKEADVVTLENASLELEGAVFSYASDAPGNNGFVLGPIDFHLSPGDLVFIVGGNGSGKSTFVKLLVGLYRQGSGEIRLGGMPITDSNRDWYRQHFSVVFSDFYLFAKLLGLDKTSLDARAQMYLRWLAIDQKVLVTEQRLSTTELSQGQRRRLALLTAYLEDRPFYVFDEWAADQDPQYKEIFYTELLPELRARGKGVAV
ncbi:MAG TPA: cyclic peptide export ABC transporter, partial [Nitrospiraceae bacterium]|nr:cyclic peptide export ABC transporter [Nitrospiraceae bacterium]